MEIQEKNDPVPVSLMLWEEGERPQMCPVRHLLTYLSLINYKSGYLFPNDLSDLHGNYTDHVPYQTFLNEFNEVCKLVLNRPGPFGTHTMRKTAYLFAIWGKAEEVELMVSARHKTVKSSIKYRKDAVLIGEADCVQRTPTVFISTAISRKLFDCCKNPTKFY